MRFTAMSDDIRTYVDLQKEVQQALRAQHPEWIEPSGDCPTCESYEQRLAELLNLFTPDHDHSDAA